MSEEQPPSSAPSAEMEKMKLENGSVVTENSATSPPPETGTKTPDKSEANKPSSPAPTAFKEIFRAFSKFGDTKSDGKHITLSQSDKWMKQAKVIDGKKITTTDTGIYFKKLKSMKVSLEDYQKFLDDLAKNKKIELDEIKNKMANCGLPGLHGVAVGGKTPSAVDRLTDPSKYTGSHRQRFDETGKGKGIAGRKDIPDSSGYVSGYQNRDTYNKTH